MNYTPPMADLPPNASLTDNDATQDELDALSGSAPAAADGDGDADDMIEQEDGSYIIKDKKPAPKRDDGFDENLAEWLPDSLLAQMGRDFCELIDADKESRSDRDKQYADGIKKTGMANNKNVGADFDGASSVVHPMLAKGCVDFASKAVKELFPSAGPVRTQILGRQTDAKLDRAERKKTYMNWQLTEQIPEHRPEFEKMLSQLPLGGSQYKRWWYDAKLGRARTMAVFIDNIFLPYDQNDFYTTPRLTHQEFIGRTEFDSRVKSGLYIDAGGSTSGERPERSEADKAAREVEGVTDDSAAYDKTGGSREVYTIYADLSLEGEDPEVDEDDTAPYILHIEEYGSKVLGIYRNWEQDDEKRVKLHWMVEYNFIPWRGAYAVGLAHLIGSMSTASTGALNALLDSAHINNFPGGLKLKGGRNSGQTITVNATELREIEAPPGVDDIRKLVMAFPFNGPSAVLYNLMEWLTQQAEMVVSTASEKIADAGANMPMGTALALIESGSTNFSAIHARLHHSARRELEILHRLNKTYLNDKETVKELGELIVYREDFAGPMDILPVSDPNIFSEAQRYAQLQAVMQLEAMPQFQPYFKPERLLIRALRLLQVPYAEDIANLPKDPTRMDPVEENSAAALDDGTPLKVYDEQDDLAHMESHVTFMTSPVLGGSKLIGQVALPKLLAHCKEHLIAYYKKHHEAAAKALKYIAHSQGTPLTDDQAHSKGHAFADKAMATQLAPMVAPGLVQAQQLEQQFQQQPQADANTQASLASQEKLSQASLASQEKLSQAQIANQMALEKDKAAADVQRHQATENTKVEIEKARIASAEKLATMQNMQQQQAAELSAKMEHLQDTNNHAIAVLTLHVQNAQSATVEENKRVLSEMAAQNAAQMAVLNALLKQFDPTPGPVGADGKPGTPTPGTPAPDITEVVEPLLAGIVQNTQRVDQHLNSEGSAAEIVLNALNGADSGAGSAPVA